MGKNKEKQKPTMYEDSEVDEKIEECTAKTLPSTESSVPCSQCGWMQTGMLASACLFHTTSFAYVFISPHMCYFDIRWEGA